MNGHNHHYDFINEDDDGHGNDDNDTHKEDDAVAAAASADDDLYAVLNVDVDASVNEIQRSYKALSRVFHPDKVPYTAAFGARDRDTSQETFVLIKLAYDVLTDPILRFAYDRFGLKGVYLIRRSQQEATAAAAAAAAAKRGDGSGGNHNGDEYEHDDDDDVHGPNLYVVLQRATSHDEAAQILADALDAFKTQQQKRRSRRWDVGLCCPHSLEDDPTSAMRNRLALHSDTASLAVQTRSQPFPKTHPQVALTMGVTSQTQRTAKTQVSAQAGVEYQVGMGTNYSATIITPWRQSASSIASIAKAGSATTDQSPQSPRKKTNNSNSVTPTLMFRTSRQFANGTLCIVSLGGNVNRANTWTYSLMTNRTILWQHEETCIRDNANQEATEDGTNRNTAITKKVTSKWIASWGAGIRPLMILVKEQQQEDSEQVVQQVGDESSENPKQYTMSKLPPSIVYLNASIANMRFPRYKLQVRLFSDNPLKVSYQFADHDSIYCTYTWSWIEANRIKIMYIRKLFAGSGWTIRYGIKYRPGLLAQVGGLGMKWLAPDSWTILIQLCSDEWTIRFPIQINTDWAGPIVSRLVMIFAADLLEDHFQSSSRDTGTLWVSSDEAQPDEQTAPSTRPNSTDEGGAILRERQLMNVVAKVAARKRQIEIARSDTGQGGLIILRAIWRQQHGLQHLQAEAPRDGLRVGGDATTADEKDVTNLLQYWVTDSQLRIPVLQARSWLQHDDANDDEGFDDQHGVQWLMDWLARQYTTTKRLLFNGGYWMEDQDHRVGHDDRSETQCDRCLALTVRYQYKSRVYEYVKIHSTLQTKQQEEEELVCLPNDHAAELGVAGQVR